jgi:ferredoxin
MKVRIDEHRCQGHGRCYSIEPEMFEPVDDDGHAGFLLDGMLADDAGLLAKAMEASANCPEHAITIDESGSAQR